MRITMISTLPPLIGLSPYTVGLVSALSKKIEIDFIGFKKLYPDFLYPGGCIDKNGKAPKFNKNVNVNNSLVWWNPITWITSGLSIDTKIVHAQWWSWFLAPVFLTVLGIAKLRGKKIIITIHNVKPHEKEFYKIWLNNSVISLGDEYLVHNQSNKVLFQKTNNTKKPIHVYPIGITEIKKSNVPTSVLRKKYKFDKNDKIVLFFGNIRNYKGLDILIKSVKFIKNKNIKLFIVGKPWKNFSSYNNLIKKEKITTRIHKILEYVPESKVAEIFKLSNVVVLPYTDFESSSAAGTLTINFHKPLVVTNVGGLTNLVSDKNTISEPNNPLNLSIKIDYALRKQSWLSTKSKEIKNQMMWNKIAKKYLLNVYI